MRPPAEVVEAVRRDRPRGRGALGALAERLAFDLTEELGYRYPDFSDRSDPAIPPARVDLRPRVRRATRQVASCYKKRRARLDDELELIGRLGLAGVLPPPPRGARAGARVRARVRRDSPRMFLPPGRGSGQLGRLDRLLSDRALARRPGRKRPLARTVPERGARGRAGHRPRLPARHQVRKLIVRVTERYGHARRSWRASRPTARGARSATSARRSGCRTASSSPARRVTDWLEHRAGRGRGRGSSRRRAKLLSKRWRAFRFLTAEIARLPRHVSQHPGGMVISSRPSSSSSPCSRRR